MPTNLRQLSDRERKIVGENAARHGQVRALDAPIADSDGGIGMPLVRLSTLTRLEHRGTISRSEAEAGERFAALFQIASLDSLKAADMSRIPSAGGMAGRDLPSSAEHCRRRVSEAMIALGGATSPAASVIWHVAGLEWSVRKWAISTGRPLDRSCGILIAALGVLAAHFNGHKAHPRRQLHHDRRGATR